MDPLVLIRDLDQRHRYSDWQDYYWADFTRTASAFIEQGYWTRLGYRRLRNFLLEQIHAGANQLYLRTIYKKYLETFDPESNLTKDLAESFQNSWTQLNLPIKEQVERFHIFDIKAAPVELVSRHIDAQPNPYESIRDIGIDAPHGQGLMHQAHLNFTAKQARGIESGNYGAALKLLDWIHPQHRDPHQNPKDALDALLLPWEHKDPRQELKDLISTRLVEAYGDLRISDSGVWQTCTTLSRQILIRWLVGATIETFFEIVTDADSSHMWPYRREFWYELYERRRIHEAWFCLSSEGRRIANQMVERNEGIQLVYAANTSINSTDRKKCLLLMKVDNHWVVEGSHSFKVHIFPQTPRSQFDTFSQTYTCEQFRSISGPEEPERIVHSSNWQSKVLHALGS